jgi:hypothetical protein
MTIASAAIVSIVVAIVIVVIVVAIVIVAIVAMGYKGTIISEQSSLNDMHERAVPTA